MTKNEDFFLEALTFDIEVVEHILFIFKFDSTLILRGFKYD